MILHGIHVAQFHQVLHIYSPDTDVFVLALRSYPRLPKDTFFVTGMGSRRRHIALAPIYDKLGQDVTSALPAFHCFTGSDTTGKFFGKGKLTCWNAFIKSSTDTKQAFTALGSYEDLNQNTECPLGSYVCKLYEPKSSETDIGKLRWQQFSKKQAEGQVLPPTKAALQQHILRARHQALLWYQDDVPNPQIPKPEEFGWKHEERVFMPVPTLLPPAPVSILQLVKCGCGSSKCSATSMCSCRRNNLNCTELCTCDADDETCTNTAVQRLEGLDDDEDAYGDDSLLV